MMLGLLKFVIFAIILIETKCEIDGIVDLTWPFSNDTIYWTGIRPFAFTKKVAEVRVDGSWYAMNEFCAGEHGGTHFDAPYHFYRKGWKVGEIPLTRLIVPGVIVDVTETGEEEMKENARLEPEHLVNWTRDHGKFPENSVLLVRFGWAQFYHDKDSYLGIDENGKLNFPGVSAEAAEWIVQSKKFVGVGVDTASVDPGKSTSFRAHQILSENQIYVLENVNIMPELPVKGFTLFVLPMKLQEGTGAPLRIVAITNVAVEPNSLKLVLTSSSSKGLIFGHLLFLTCGTILCYIYTMKVWD